MKVNYKQSRRNFLKTTAVGAAGAFAVPVIAPSSVFGAGAPSNRINIGAIGCGRISREHDMPGVWRDENVRIVAVCDLDAKRLDDAKKLVGDYYSKKLGKPYNEVRTYESHLELLGNKDIDAVLISTPDHQHAKEAIDAVRAGKDVYLQKPTSLTISISLFPSNSK